MAKNDHDHDADRHKAPAPTPTVTAPITDPQAYKLDLEAKQQRPLEEPHKTPGEEGREASAKIEEVGIVEWVKSHDQRPPVHEAKPPVVEGVRHKAA